MPMMFKAIAMGSGEPIKHTLSNAVTPDIGQDNQWSTFYGFMMNLVLNLYMYRKRIEILFIAIIVINLNGNFRVGEGISARLSELFDRDVNKIALSYSLMLTLLGTPVVYYGDEFGKLNDEKYYNEQIKLTGKDDTRFLVRGRIDWEKLENDLGQPENFHAQVFNLISNMLNTRKNFLAFGRVA